MDHRILVTGGSGFIGSHVSRALREKWPVRILDITGGDPDGRSDFVRGDVTDFDAVVRATKQCDIVVHLAGFLGVAKTETDPLQTLKVNTEGTLSVLEACRLNDVKKIIFSSSSEIYGEPVSLPIRESDPPRPVTTYGVSKLAAEHYIYGFAKAYGIKYAILRFFNVYGPGQRTEFVVPRFVSLAIRDEPILIDGDGSQVRAFCEVGDAASAAAMLVERGDDEVFNIGNDKEPISILELAGRVVSLVGSKSATRLQPFSESDRRRPIEISRRIPSIDKARGMLGYEPRVTLEQGISILARSMGRALP